jgi:hypothetical protein
MFPIVPRPDQNAEAQNVSTPTPVVSVTDGVVPIVAEAFTAVSSTETTPLAVTV